MNNVIFYRIVFALALFIVPAMAGFATAEDWPHWRGLARSGVVSEHSGWRDGSWLPDQPIWTANAGRGATSPVVVGNRLFVMGWQAGVDRVTCLDADTGQSTWSQTYPCPERGRHATGDEGFYSGPSATPSYDAQTQRLFTLSTDGDLHAWDAGTGRQLWHRNLYDSYGMQQRPKVGRAGRRDYGFTSSPLVLDDAVLVEVGADAGTLMAFSKDNGQRLWTSECNDPAGHTGSPVPITVEGLPCVAVLTLNQLLVARLDARHEGQTLATYPWITDFANNIPTPAVEGNHVLITTKYNHQAICKLKITRAGAERVWQQPLASGVCSPIVHAGRIYWSTHRAVCLEYATGQLRWQGGKFGDAGSCILTSDEKLIVWAARGTLALLEASPDTDAYRELARRQISSSGDVWPHVVLSRGRLICKDREGKLICFAVPGSVEGKR